MNSTENKAFYYFRAKIVFVYNKDTKQLDIGNEAELCSFISEDLKLMSDFLMACYNHIKTGTDVQNVEVD